MAALKKTALPLYLLPEVKEFVREQAKHEGETMNTWISDLIKAERKRQAKKGK